MDFNIDGKALIDTLILANASQSGDKFLPAVASVFQKHDISLMDGLAILLELSTAIEGLKSEGEE